jgi:N-acetylglucosamine-6-phosphate deacetylase
VKPTLISNVRLVHPGERTERGDVLLEAGRIARLGPGLADAYPDAERFDGAGRLLTPGLIDLHVHGIHTFNFDRGPEDLLAAASVFGRYGTTCVVPTLLANKTPDLPARLERISAAVPKVAGVSVPGLHLEGPFVTVPGAGCVPLDGDVGYLDEMVAACGGRVRIMSVAPDTKNVLAVIERLGELGIVPFLTHTRASAEQTLAAIDAGARHATHFFNVFHPPPPREVGVYPVGAVEAILADARATCDLICDGVHVDPLAVRFTLAIKGPSKVSLITDGNVGAGLPPCVYATPWGYPVKVDPDDGARIDDPAHPYHGALAGSALTMNRGMRNLLAWGFVPPEQTWGMGSRNPAGVLGLEGKGVLAEGADADVVVWNEDLAPAATWVGGVCVYPS